MYLAATTPAGALCNLFHGQLAGSEMATPRALKALETTEPIFRWVMGPVESRRWKRMRPELGTRYEAFDRARRELASDGSADAAPSYAKAHATFWEAKREAYSFLLRQSYEFPLLGAIWLTLDGGLHQLTNTALGNEEALNLTFRLSRYLNAQLTEHRVRPYRGAGEMYVVNPHNDGPSPVRVPEMYADELSLIWRISASRARKLSRSARGWRALMKLDADSTAEDRQNAEQLEQLARYEENPLGDQALIDELVRLVNDPPWKIPELQGQLLPARISSGPITLLTDDLFNRMKTSAMAGALRVFPS